MIGGVHVAGPLCGQSPSCRGGELLRQSGRYRASRLLLHGFPETHACWHRIAPRLAESHRVVAPDLRGYGASEAPPGGPLGERYTKREMAAELVALMSDLGHERFAVVGHDRGGRVGYRLALDHPGRVTRAALLNIVPTLDQFERMAAHPSLGYWTWFLLAQPAPFPEKLVLAEPRALLDHVFATWASDPEAIAPAQREAYLRALTPSTAAAMCADFRASFHLDRQHERDDRATGRRIASPVLVVTGQDEAQLADAPRRVGGMDRRPHGAARRRRPLQPRGSARPGHRPPCGLPREPPTRMTGGRAMQRPRGAARSRCRGQPPATKATTT